MGGISCQPGERFSWLLPDFHSRFPTKGDDLGQAFIVPLPRHADVVESPVSGPKCLPHRMQAKKDFH